VTFHLKIITNKGPQGHHKETPAEDVILSNFTENHSLPVGRLQSIHTRMSSKCVHLYVKHLLILRPESRNIIKRKRMAIVITRLPSYVMCTIFLMWLQI